MLRELKMQAFRRSMMSTSCIIRVQGSLYVCLATMTSMYLLHISQPRGGGT